MLFDMVVLRDEFSVWLTWVVVVAACKKAQVLQREPKLPDEPIASSIIHPQCCTIPADKDTVLEGSLMARIVPPTVFNLSRTVQVGEDTAATVLCMTHQYPPGNDSSLAGIVNEPTCTSDVLLAPPDPVDR